MFLVSDHWLIFFKFSSFCLLLNSLCKLDFLILIVNIWDGPARCFGVATHGKGEGSSQMGVGWWVVRRAHGGVGWKSTEKNCDVRGWPGAEESKAGRQRKDWWFLAGVNLPKVHFYCTFFFTALLLSSQIPTEAVCSHVHGSAILSH